MTKFFSSILGFVAEIPAIQRDLEATDPMILERAAQIVEKCAKGMIGKEHEGWPPLSESTIENKQHGGYATPKPLLRSGEFRDSIEHVVKGHEAEVGTNDPRGPWFEYGTSRMPPRPVLVPAAMASEDKIHRMAAGATIAALSGGRRGARDMQELMHLLREVGSEYSELAHDLVGDEDQGDDR